MQHREDVMTVMNDVELVAETTRISTSKASDHAKTIMVVWVLCIRIRARTTVRIIRVLMIIQELTRIFLRVCVTTNITVAITQRNVNNGAVSHAETTRP